MIRWLRRFCVVCLAYMAVVLWLSRPAPSIDKPQATAAVEQHSNPIPIEPRESVVGLLQDKESPRGTVENASAENATADSSRTMVAPPAPAAKPLDVDGSQQPAEKSDLRPLDKRAFEGLHVASLSEIVRRCVQPQRQRAPAATSSKTESAGPPPAGDVVVRPAEMERRQALWRHAVQRRKLQGRIIAKQAEFAQWMAEAQRFEDRIPTALAAYDRELRSEYVVRTQFDDLGRYISVVEPRYTAAQIQGFLSVRERELKAELFAYRDRISKMNQELERLRDVLAGLKFTPPGKGS